MLDYILTHLSSASDRLAAASLVATIAAIIIAIVTLRRGNKNSSAANIISLNEELRSAWQRVFASKEDKVEFELAELLNILEIACALDKEGSLSGVSKRLLRDYIEKVILLLENTPGIDRLVADLVDAPDTYDHILWFKKRMKGKRLFLWT